MRLPKIKRLLLAALGATFLAAEANAAFITTWDADMDAIFSQASFGANTIDVRYNAPQTLFAPQFLTIDDGVESLALLQTASLGPVIDMYFVDSIANCGPFPGPTIRGCGRFDNGGVYVESVFTSSAATGTPPTGPQGIALGASLQAHEIGHNLGLNHVSGVGNLMNPSVNFNVLITDTQAATILSSPLVQMDTSGQRFIEINPWLVTNAATVPLPSTGLLLLCGLGTLALFRRRTSA